MKDHNLGDQVFTETKIKDKDGKEKRISDVAQDSWGAPPKDSTKAARSAVEGAISAAEKAIGTNEKVSSATEKAINATERASSAIEHTIGASAERRNAEQTTTQHQEQLIEASKRIKLLNNELHKPGGALANSDLELIGFDKTGRLLMIHRDKSGHVDGKFLVDHESGQIVAKTKKGQLDKWDKSPDYDRKDRERGSHPKDWYSEPSHGATVWKDSQGHLREVNRPNGDRISVTLDTQGKPSEINVSYAARDGKSGRVEQFKVSANGDVIVQSQGIKEAWHKLRDSAQKAEILNDGSLQLQLRENERRTLRPDGSTVDTRRINGQWVTTQVADAYGDRREYKWDEKATKLTEVTITHASNKTSETFRPGGSVDGVQQDFWYRYPSDPKNPGSGQKFQVDSDGTLRQFVKATEFIIAKPNGSVHHTVGNETTILRPPFRLPEITEPNQLLSVPENIAPEPYRKS